MILLEEEAREYAQNTKIPFMSPQASDVVVKAIEQAYIAGAKREKQVSEEKHNANCVCCMKIRTLEQKRLEKEVARLKKGKKNV